MDKKAIEKEAIIADYLTGNSSYRKLGMKYGIDFRLIQPATEQPNNPQPNNS